MSNINVMRKNLGPVTAYKYAVSQGYTGTEQEFAVLMASYATVAQEAESAKDDAIDAKTAAEAAQAAAEAAAEQAEGAIEVDDTLSIEGRAAGSKVVGEKFNLLAEFTEPFNYGPANGYTLGKVAGNANISSTIDEDGVVTITKDAAVNVTCYLKMTGVDGANTYRIKGSFDKAVRNNLAYIYKSGALAKSVTLTDNKFETEYEWDGSGWFGVGFEISYNTSSIDVNIGVYKSGETVGVKIVGDNLSNRVSILEETTAPPFVIQSTNTFFGDGAGENTAEEIVTEVDDGKYNAAFGYKAMNANTAGDHCAAFGYQALHKNTTGDCNTGFGEDALFQNTTGEYNTCVGTHALQNNNANGNTAVGCNAARYVETGAGNTIVGNQAAPNLRTGANNVMIGDYVGNTAPDHSNCIAIGQVVPTGNNQVMIGNSHIAELIFRFSEGYKKIIFNQDGTVTWEPFTVN